MPSSDTALRLESAPFRLSEFIRKNASNWAERTFGETFLRYARGYGRSQRYQSSLKIDMKNMDLTLELDYRGVDNDEPLGRWFEEGTERHFIAPLENNKSGRLFWITPSGTFASSKGHFVSGITPMPIMESTLRDGMPLFKSMIASETQKFQEMTALR